MRVVQGVETGNRLEGYAWGRVGVVLLLLRGYTTRPLAPIPCLFHRASRARYIFAVMDSGPGVDPFDRTLQPYEPNLWYRGDRSVPLVKVKKERAATPKPPRAKTHPMHRRVKRLYTLAEVADRLGCSVSTVKRLRRTFMDQRQLEYLKLAGYSACFYPIRKEEREL